MDSRQVAILTGGNIDKSPVATLDFSSPDVVSSNITFTRASKATYFDATGTMLEAATNTPRIDYGPVPSGVTNWVPNSTASGVVPGNPGTSPTGWIPTGGGAISRQILAAGTSADGIPYVDIRFVGVPTIAGQLKLNITLMPVTQAIFGQSWTTSAYIQVLSDFSTIPVTGLNFTLPQTGTAGTTYLSSGAIPVANLTNFTRQSATVVTNSSTITGVTLSIWSTGPTTVINDTIDITLRIGAPQLEKSTSLNPWVPTSGTIATVGATALGMLIEETRTNGIRNPRCENAVVGTPGTLPSNWNYTAGVATSGLTSQVVAVGTETGIPYIDFRLSGTVTTVGNVGVYMETTSGIAATFGQTWSISAYWRLVAGTTANLTSPTIAISEIDSGGSGLATDAHTVTAPTNATLASQHLAWAGTLSAGAVAFLRPVLYFAAGLGAVDITVRVGGPQLELGTFATSLMMAPVGSPAASTRAAEYATAPIVYPVTAGTIGVDALSTQLTPASDLYLLTTTGATQTLRSFFRNNGTEPAAALEGAATSTIDIGGSYIGVPIKHVVSFKQSQLISGVNSVAPATNTVTGTLAGTWATVAIGTDFVGGTAWNGWIKRIRYWNRALGITEVQSATN